MLSTIFISWVAIILLMVFVWVIFLWKNNPGIIDAFWSIGLSLSAFIFCPINIEYSIRLIYQFFLVIWAVRLSGYIFLKRILPQHLDQRYEQLSNDWKISKKIGFLFNYQFQGILAIIISTPFIFINQLADFNFLSILSIIIISSGIIGESIADLQLQKFKKSNLRGVCNIGLWNYSRHPNYFFEWLVWVGFSLPGLALPLGWLGFISPLLLLFIMLKVTGPMTEKQSIKSRGAAYIEYQKKTSMFIPLPHRY